jgi:hypothetical protein
MHAPTIRRLASRTALVLAVMTVPWDVHPLLAQVPSRVPSDPAAQIFSLIQRVTALEEKLAALTNGSTPLRVKAPFEVVDAGGRSILKVTTFDAAVTEGGTGMLIIREPTSGATALLAHNKAGKGVVALGSDPDGFGQLTLRNAQGKTQATLAGEGTLSIADPQGEEILAVAEDVSKSDANVRIGGADDGYAVEVGNGKGMASLGIDPEGVAELTLMDAQNRPRVTMSAEGTLEVADPTGYNILSVLAEVSGEKAGVTIGGGKTGGIVRVADGAGKPAAGIIGSSRSVVAANAAGKTVVELTAKASGEGLVQVMMGDAPVAVLSQAEGGGGIVQLTNGRVPVSSLYSSEGGSGRLQLNDGSGNPVVEAGVLTTGRGVVRAGPKYICGPAPGMGMVPSPVPNCIMGLVK